MKISSLARLISALLLPAACILASTAGNCPPLQHSHFGSIHRHYVYSPEMADTITIDVWTPRGYDPERSEPYPALYMHDGQNVFDPTTTWNAQAWRADSTASALAARGEIRLPVIIAVHSVNQTRIGDLMPAAALDCVPGLRGALSHEFPGMVLRGQQYTDFLASTLAREMKERYNIASDPANTSVMGSSMGGLMSLYTLCEHPEVFGNAACLSTHWIGTVNKPSPFPLAMERYAADKLPRDNAHRIYIDTGTQSLDSLYGPAHVRMTHIIDSIGYRQPAQFQSRVFEGGRHEEDSWAARLAAPLIFLLGK